MGKAARLTVVFLMIGVIALSGCASRKTSRKVDTLQAQMGVVTDELVRLDQSLQDTRAALQAEEAKKGQLQGELGATESQIGALQEEEGVIKGIYRTPSGFELPSVNIQKALKKAGYYDGKLDGKIGPATRDAIRAFQKDNGFKADGVCGRKTWAKLKSYLDSIK
ncbi:MAG TPA: peptidoglycan-binding protein [Candidatus Omnitrophota bacterium]|nr:peptidoglycan-binding protein [Candidatus Omnitrophota bacterium]HPS36413.1 peptidoglycan-binding protein [Candidatus Omnitrophota bacterium]